MLAMVLAGPHAGIGWPEPSPLGRLEMGRELKGMEESQVSSLQEEVAKLIPAPPAPCAQAPLEASPRPKPHSATKRGQTGRIFQAEREIRLGQGSWKLERGPRACPPRPDEGETRLRAGQAWPRDAQCSGGLIPLRKVHHV